MSWQRLPLHMNGRVLNASYMLSCSRGVRFQENETTKMAIMEVPSGKEIKFVGFTSLLHNMLWSLQLRNKTAIKISHKNTSLCFTLQLLSFF